MIPAVFLAAAARLRLTGRAQRVVAVVLAVAALVALLGALRGAWAVFDWFNDRKAVQVDRAAGNAEIRAKQIVVERKAGAAMDARLDAIGNQQVQAEEKAHAARRNRHSALDDLD
jgi:hypothetical protein